MSRVLASKSFPQEIDLITVPTDASGQEQVVEHPEQVELHVEWLG